jgi:phosphoserine phosphatase
MGNRSILLTVTGPDRPGITSTLTGILDESHARLIDIDQVVVRGVLTLCMVIEPHAEMSILKELLFAAKELGVELDFKPVPDGPARVPGERYVVTLIGNNLQAAHVCDISSLLASERANIERIQSLSEGPLSSIEILLELPSGADPESVRRQLLAISTRRGCDIALQREGLYRRAKRLVVMDMDSTLIRIEVIDELARAHGVGEEVSKITELAMEGKLDYDQSLRRRVELLAGLDEKVVRNLAANLPLTEGGETLIEVLKRLGYRVAVISGGFSIAAEALKKRLDLDYAYSNTLEIKNGKLTGRVIGPLVNAQRKAELLETIAQAEGLLLDQVIAIGDGANDILMLEKAGLGIAFRAKEKLREAADTAITASGLDAILYLLGLSARELRQVREAQSNAV